MVETTSFKMLKVLFGVEPRLVKKWVSKLASKDTVECLLGAWLRPRDWGDPLKRTMSDECCADRKDCEGSTKKAPSL